MFFFSHECFCSFNQTIRPIAERHRSIRTILFHIKASIALLRFRIPRTLLFSGSHEASDVVRIGFNADPYLEFLLNADPGFENI